MSSVSAPAFRPTYFTRACSSCSAVSARAMSLSARSTSRSTAAAGSAPNSSLGDAMIAGR
jgi:hypothetical protein